jgi:hypothetical protein
MRRPSVTACALPQMPHRLGGLLLCAMCGLCGTPTAWGIEAPQHIMTGIMPCASGQHILVKEIGPFGYMVHHGAKIYAMEPVAAQEGVFRIEDPYRSVVWLQSANQSMLLDSKFGRRLAHDCQSPEQKEVDEFLKHHKETTPQ